MPRRELGVRRQETGAARERSTAAVAAGIRSWELGVKGGCGRRGGGEAISPDTLVLQHRDFGIHALTGMAGLHRCRVKQIARQALAIARRRRYNET